MRIYNSTRISKRLVENREERIALIIDTWENNPTIVDNAISKHVPDFRIGLLDIYYVKDVLKNLRTRIINKIMKMQIYSMILVS